MPPALVLGVVLVVLGAACWVLHGVQAGYERHSYAPGRPPPTYVQVRTGHTYRISLPGGVATEAERGVSGKALRCTLAAPGSGPGALTITPLQAASRATDQIASFAAPASGRVHVACSGLGPLYIDDAADSTFDWSGLLLVLAAIMLAIGVPLTLAALRRRQRLHGLR